MPVLTYDFYNRSPVIVARDLLGKLLVRENDEGRCAGRIVETEAYLAEEDSACHSFRGLTRRNAVMFGKAGVLYVYVIHARFCLNVVTEPEGTASAVLIRAVEPREGLDLMRQRRGTEKIFDLARGPARLCEAFAVDRRLNGWDLIQGQQIWLASGPEPLTSAEIGTSVRIGVTSAHDLPLRFFLRGNPFVSGTRKNR